MSDAGPSDVCLCAVPLLPGVSVASVVTAALHIPDSLGLSKTLGHDSPLLGHKFF